MKMLDSGSEINSQNTWKLVSAAEVQNPARKRHITSSAKHPPSTIDWIPAENFVYSLEWTFLFRLVIHSI